MKRKLVLRLLSLSLAAAVTGTMFPSSVYFVHAEENAAEVQNEFQRLFCTCRRKCSGSTE